MPKNALNNTTDTIAPTSSIEAADVTGSPETSEFEEVTYENRFSLLN
jgi:hypothetical protein